MARFVLYVLDGRDGVAIATEEVEIVEVSELPDLWFELAATSPKPTYGLVLPVDDDALDLVAAALEALPDDARALWLSQFKRSLSS